jgi:hypothetical protein
VNDLPNDVNGDVLRRMLASGDDLSRPRMIDFCFVFPERSDALAFANVFDFDQPDDEVSISRYENEWQAVVHRVMSADHAAITRLEALWGSGAGTFRGRPDGWGCMIPERALKA